MTLVDFVKIFRKWLFFSHSGLPASFKRAGWMRAVPGLSAWAMLVAGVALASAPVVATGVAALVVFTGSQLWLSRDLGGAAVSPRHYWLAAALPFLATGVAVSTKLSHEVSWRGRRYRLDHAGRLAAASPRRSVARAEHELHRAGNRSAQYVSSCCAPACTTCRKFAPST